MTNVMIVEDDKLTRKGIISSVPWSDYQMQIVFETGNGISALEYLKDNPVDLIITDIAMPIMSGMELLRAVKKDYPSVQVVVLTMYQNFEYVQEALRLGALDYIGKYQLDQEEISDVIGQISNRLREVSHDSKLPAEIPRDGACYVSLDLEQQDENIHAFFLEHSLNEIKLNDHITLYYFCKNHEFLINPERIKGFDDQLSPLIGHNTMIIKLLDANNYKDAALFQSIPSETISYFYMFHSGLSQLSVSQLKAQNKSTNFEYYNECKETLLSLYWIYDTNTFVYTMNKIREGRIPYPKLIHLLVRVVGKIQDSYSFLHCTSSILIPDTFLCFEHAYDWLSDIALHVREAMEVQSYSPYVIECLRKAIQIIETEFDSPLQSDAVARRVHLSRSYFCQIFKKITKMSFNHYVRNVRMDKAKELLTKTDLSLQKIAEKVGYSDEKYFSRLFQSATGIPPSIYRSKTK